MIRVDGLTKHYRRHVVLDDVSFEVADGEAVAFWGPNGAGKTTIVRCILNLVRYEGIIEVNGLDARRRPKAVRALAGYVPQELSFYDDLTIAETLQLSARIRRVGDERALEVVDLVDLGPHVNKRVRELSGGMKQRLGVALALLSDPPVLLLDEPTSSLDVAAREQMVRLIEDLRSPGRVVVLTSHHVDEVGMLVDRVLAMEDGRIIEECAPSELAERLGLHSWLHVILANGHLDRAVEVLSADGFAAHRNSKGVLVEVSAQRKAAALSRLRDSGIDIVDFEVWR